MCANYSLPPFDWLKLSHHLVSGESTLHEVTLFEARSRIFLPTAESCVALFCCRLAIRASSLGWLVGNNVSTIIWVVMPLSYQVKKFTGHGGRKYIQIIQIFVCGGRKLNKTENEREKK